MIREHWTPLVGGMEPISESGLASRRSPRSPRIRGTQGLDAVISDIVRRAVGLELVPPAGGAPRLED